MARHWSHDQLGAVVDRVHTDAGGCRALLAATLHERGTLLDGERSVESSGAPYSMEFELRRDDPGSSRWRIINGRLL